MPPVQKQRFIILPARGMVAEGDSASSDSAAALRRMKPGSAVAPAPPSALAADARPTAARAMRRAVAHAAPARATHRKASSGTVLESLAPTGAKLVEMDAEDVHALHAESPDLRIVPERYYKRLMVLRPTAIHPPARRMVTKAGRRAAAGTGGRGGPRVRIVSAVDGKPLRGVTVEGFTNYNAEEGSTKTTDRNGWVTLALPSARIAIDRLVVTALDHWVLWKDSFRIENSIEIALTPFDPNKPDVLRASLGSGTLRDGQRVKVGVIDGRVDRGHPDLSVATSYNYLGKRTTARGTPDAHGTHVAGIIAARGAGMRGVAPGVTLNAYQIFRDGAPDDEGAWSWSIVKAFNQAVKDGCDLINLSIGQPDDDPAIASAIKDAFDLGTVTFAAAGNDGRGEVDYPAAMPAPTVAVSAFGRKGTFPANSPSADEIARPYGLSKSDFVGAFADKGRAIDVIAPGVAIVSTVPGGYREMDGTSMACPAATGTAARMLGRRADLRRMSRDVDRGSAILKAFFALARPLGFGVVYEGSGFVRLEPASRR